MVRKVESAKDQVVKRHAEMEELRRQEAEAEAALEASLRLKSSESGGRLKTGESQAPASGGASGKDQVKLLREQVGSLARLSSGCGKSSPGPRSR